MLRILSTILWLTLSATSTCTQAEETRPDALIKDIAQDVLSIVKQDRATGMGLKKNILKLVDAKVLPNFDWERMTRLAVGRNWHDATPMQRMNLLTEFRNLLVHTYTDAFTRYDDQTLDVKPLQATDSNPNEVTVKTLILKAGTEPISVDYEMENTAAGWKVFDLTVEGVSLVVTYRGTFSDQIAAGGIDGLIKTLIEKNASNSASQ